MVEAAVVNASPLIFLSRAGHLALLRLIAERVLVPEPVAREVQRRGASDPTVRALAQASWIERAPAPTVGADLIAWDLGPGETSVLALARGLRQQ